MKTYCPPDCFWLSPTEEEQDANPIGNGIHMCGKFNKRVMHLGAHPQLLRVEGCDWEKTTSADLLQELRSRQLTMDHKMVNKTVKGVNISNPKELIISFTDRTYIRFVHSDGQIYPTNTPVMIDSLQGLGWSTAIDHEDHRIYWDAFANEETSECKEKDVEELKYLISKYPEEAGDIVKGRE